MIVFRAQALKELDRLWEWLDALPWSVRRVDGRLTAAVDGFRICPF